MPAQRLLKSKNAKADNAPPKSSLPARLHGVYLDQCSIEILCEIGRREGMRRNEAFKKILGQVVSREVHPDAVREFYRNVWSLVVPDSRKEFDCQRWPEELDGALLDLSDQVLGVINRSEMVRILIAYYGVHSGAARVKQTKALRLFVSSKASE